MGSPPFPKTLSQLGLKRWFDRLNVSHKITWGYVIALGCAVGGIIVGGEVGDYYLWQAWQLEDHAQRETDLLHRLQTDILKVQTHQQHLIFLIEQANLIEQPEQFQKEYTELLEHAESVKRTWAEVDDFVATEEYTRDEVHVEMVPQFLQTYQEKLDAYDRQLRVLVTQINPAALQSPEAIAAAQASLIAFASSPQSLMLMRISDELSDLVSMSSQDHQRAIAAYDAADILRLQIVAGSMVLSGAIAVLLGLYISRVIARPLRSVTQVAQQVSQDSNFDLQAPVTTADEVGVLATSLNQLIQRVKQLLADQTIANEQLESYSRTLEEKVQKRTQALKDANELLESYSHTLEEKVLERTQTLNQQNEYLQQTLQELQQTQALMIQSEKMSSLGQMVAGVAHEINNPVSFIHGNIKHAQRYIEDLMRLVQLYQQQYPSPSSEIEETIETIDLEFVSEDLPKLIQSMQVGADRIREIVASLRMFARSNDADVQPVDIHQGIDSTLMILHHRLKAQPHRAAIAVVKEYGQLPLVECCAGQLNQVFMNVLSNAIDALEERFEVADSSASHPPVIKIHTQAEGDRVTIGFGDNGNGIPEAVQEHLFDSFFTTKPVGKGTGLGLSISYQIVVEKHGGEMLCRSSPGEGTEFVIHLPIQQSVDVEL